MFRDRTQAWRIFAPLLTPEETVDAVGWMQPRWYFRTGVALVLAWLIPFTRPIAYAGVDGIIVPLDLGGYASRTAFCLTSQRLLLAPVAPVWWTGPVVEAKSVSRERVLCTAYRESWLWSHVDLSVDGHSSHWTLGRPYRADARALGWLPGPPPRGRAVDAAARS